MFGQRLEGDRLASGSSSMICGQGQDEGPSSYQGGVVDDDDVTLRAIRLAEGRPRGSCFLGTMKSE